LSFRVSVIVTLGALAVLAVFWVSAVPHFDLKRWALDNGPWFPSGLAGIFAALPFAVWLFLAIEQLPLAAEESADPKRDMPKGLIRSEEHTSELQSRFDLVCRLLLEKKHARGLRPAQPLES